MDLGIVLVVSAVTLTAVSIVMVVERRKRALREQRELYQAVVELATTVERTARIISDDASAQRLEGVRSGVLTPSESPAFDHLLLIEWFGPSDGASKSGLDPNWTYFDSYEIDGQRVPIGAWKPLRQSNRSSNRPNKSPGAANLEELWQRTTRGSQHATPAFM